jgi:hypothetical protein
MGEVVHQRSDFVILTDADPGLEDPREILQVGCGCTACRHGVPCALPHTYVLRLSLVRIAHGFRSCRAGGVSASSHLLMRLLVPLLCVCCVLTAPAAAAAGHCVRLAQRAV